VWWAQPNAVPEAGRYAFGTPIVAIHLIDAPGRMDAYIEIPQRPNRRELLRFYEDFTAGPKNRN